MGSASLDGVETALTWLKAYQPIKITPRSIGQGRAKGTGLPCDADGDAALDLSRLRVTENAFCEYGRRDMVEPSVAIPALAKEVDLETLVRRRGRREP